MGESIDRLQITQTEFQGGTITHLSTGGNAPEESTVVKDTRIENNMFVSGHQLGKATRASLSLTQSNATQWTFDFSSQLVFPNITRVRHSLSATTGFARAVARPAQGAVVVIETDVAVTGTILVDVDTVEYMGGFW
jgi:hypothetical protein